MAAAIRRQFSIYHIRSAWPWPAMQRFTGSSAFISFTPSLVSRGAPERGASFLRLPSLRTRADGILGKDMPKNGSAPGGNYRTKVRPGSLGLSPASLKLKRSFASAATWPTIMGLAPCLRTRRLSATVYVPLNC